MANSRDVILKVMSYKDFIEKYKRTKDIKTEVTKKQYEDIITRRNLTIGRKYSALELARDEETKQRVFMLKDDNNIDFFAKFKKYTIFSIKKGANNA